MSVVRPQQRPPVTAPGRGPVVALAAGAVVVVLVIWLVLRYLSAGSDASDATTAQTSHGAASQSLTKLDMALAEALRNPAVLFQDDSVQARIDRAASDAANQLRGPAGNPADAQALTTASSAFDRVMEVLPTAAGAAPPITQGSGASGPDGTTNSGGTKAGTTATTTNAPAQLAADTETARYAAQTLKDAAAGIKGSEDATASAAGQALSDANSSRRMSLLFLVLLFVLTGAVVIAWFAGLLPVVRPADGPHRRIPAQPPAYPATGPFTQDARFTPDVSFTPDVPFNQDDAWAGGSPSTGAIPVAYSGGPPAYLSSSAPEIQRRPMTRARTGGAPRAKLSVTTSAHPGTTLDAAEHAGMAVFAGSMIGPEHRAGKNVAPREDAYGWAPGLDSSVIAVAVADGVGSARNSHAASLIATEIAIAHLRQASSAQVAAWYERPERWTEQAHTLMSSIASYLSPEQVDARARMIEPSTSSSNSGQRSPDPATTLVIALGVVSGDGVRVLWASVGDSQVSVLAPGAAHLSWTQDEGDSPSGTRALPRDASRVISSQYLLPPGHAFLLLTDGAEKVLTLDPSTVSLLHELVQTPGDTGPLLDLLQRNPRGAGDDRTLVMFAPVGGTR